MKVYVLFLLNMLIKVKKNLFCKHEYKNKNNFFSQSKLKFNLEPRT